jgi:hypothetical protein
MAAGVGGHDTFSDQKTKKGPEAGKLAAKGAAAYLLTMELAEIGAQQFGANSLKGNFFSGKKNKKTLKVGVIGRQGILGKPAFSSQIVKKEIAAAGHVDRQRSAALF